MADKQERSKMIGKPPVHRPLGIGNRKQRPHPRSAEADVYRPWYKTPAWKAARSAQLARQPLCERCEKAGRITPATVVHHRKAHKGDWSLFIDPDNHESLCAPHHDTLAQREEARGYTIGCDMDGHPVDPAHPWNRT